jgi:short subunit dehydrogenase-like uncharacterized protein
MSERIYDVVIWGASGFTGRLVVEYMYRAYGRSGDVRWAVAGRNEQKLQQVLQDTGCSSNIPILIADSSDEASLRSLAEQTKVVCTTVGPYAKYGSLLVQFCAETGTHYTDLTGEIHWMRRMIDQHHVEAQKSGARIVHTCGFDSIPSDLGVFLLQRAMFEKHGVYSPNVKYRVVKASGGVSGGTIDSVVNMMEESKSDPSILPLMADPYALNPLNMPSGEDKKDKTSVFYDEDFEQWTAPFVMAGVNTRVVRRSHSLLGYPWGNDFRYDEAVLVGDGPGGIVKAWFITAATGLLIALTVFSFTRKLFARLAPSPGEGPSPEAIRKGFFNIELFASHPDDPERSMVAIVTGDRDPGYGATSKMIAESAVCLAKDELDTPTGVLTPAVAMGQRLIDRLQQNAGMSFTLK